MTETAILKTSAHELTHFIQANSAQYEALKSFVVNKLTHEEGVSFEDLVADKQRWEPGLEYDEAVDEVVADACEMMLGDSTVVEQLAKENLSLAEKIRDWLREWVENLKIALEGLQADRTESRTMMQYARELQGIWDNALMDAARNNRGTAREAAPAESRWQVRENISNEIDSWARDGMPEGVRFTLGSTGPVLQGLGAIESDIYMEGDKIQKILQDHPEMTLAEIKKVPQILEDPALILKSEGRGKSGANSRLVCFGLTKAQNGQPVMTVMDLRPRENGFVVDDMQKVNSAYTKKNPMAFIQKSDVVYADKKRAIPLLRTTGLTISSQQLLRNGYIGSISYKGSSVNIEGVPFSSVVKMEANDKVQSSMRDSVGRELTEAQQAYFKDSKVRDADGNLLVMYHQTGGTFTVFDTKHKGAGAGDDETPFGIFLKRTSRNIGVRGEKQMELYADIRNPLRVRDRTELVNKLRELSVDYARLKDESAQIDKEYGAKFEEAKNAFKSFLIQWRKNNPDAPPRAAYDADGFDAAFNAEDNVVKEWTRAKDELALRAKTSITQALRDNGYDGVILENDKGSWGRSTDAYIALDANQVKNTTNKTPTADPDIRYQQRDNLKEEYHLTDDEESAIRGATREAAPAESRRQAQAESGESIEPGEKPLKGKHDNDKMGAVKDSLKEDLKNGKARKEDRGAFLRRATGEGLRVFEGDSIAYGYRSVRRESARENARQIQEELTELGIDAEITDGYVHWNLDGISYKRAISQAVTIERRRILISNRVSLPSKNAAGHEAFHLWGSTQAREAYANEVADNLNYSSREFVEYQAVIAEAYLGGEADLSDSTQLQKLREELFAYISGDIHEGVNDDLLRPMFHDYDAVKAAWVKLCKDNSGGEVRFSARDVGGETMPVLDIQNDTRDYKVAETYLKTLVNTEHPFATILVDAQPVYIGKDLPGEYKGSEYTHGLNSSTRQVKMQAATNLDEMLLLAENGEWRDNVKEKHKQDAKNGWYRYSTRFALPVLDIKKAVDHYTVYSGTLLIRNDADGKSYLYDLLDIKKEKVISSPSFSAQERSEVFEPKPSQKQYMQNSRESQAENIEKNQQRDPRLSDRDVLRMAADMAQRDRSQRWSVEDLNRFDLLQRKLLQLDEANAELEALKEERKVLLAGRKVKELTRDEQFELAQNRNRTETQKGKMFVNRIQRVARNNIS